MMQQHGIKIGLGTIGIIVAIVLVIVSGLAWLEFFVEILVLASFLVMQG